MISFVAFKQKVKLTRRKGDRFTLSSFGVHKKQQTGKITMKKAKQRKGEKEREKEREREGGERERGRQRGKQVELKKSKSDFDVLFGLLGAFC